MGAGKGAVGAAGATITATGATAADVDGSSRVTDFLAASGFFLSMASSSTFGFFAAKKSKTEKLGFFLVMLWASLDYLILSVCFTCQF